MHSGLKLFIFWIQVSFEKKKCISAMIFMKGNLRNHINSFTKPPRVGHFFSHHSTSTLTHPWPSAQETGNASLCNHGTGWMWWVACLEVKKICVTGSEQYLKGNNNHDLSNVIGIYDAGQMQNWFASSHHPIKLNVQIPRSSCWSTRN